MYETDINDLKTEVVFRSLCRDSAEGTLSCGFLQKLSDSRSQPNLIIPYYSCFVLLRGSGQYYDGRHGVIPLKAGCVVQRNPGLEHTVTITGDGNWLEFYIIFGRSAWKSLVSVGLINPDVPVLQMEALPQVQELKDIMHCARTAAESNLFEVLVSLQRLAVNWLCGSAPAQSKPDWLEEARQLLSEKLEQRVSIGEIAAKLFMTEVSFRRRFQAATGVSPLAFRLNQKMQAARMRLLSGERVKTIAPALGYSDSFTFSKQFLRVTGLSPSAFVREAKERKIK